MISGSSVVAILLLVGVVVVGLRFVVCLLLA